jgi:integrase
MTALGNVVQYNNKNESKNPYAVIRTFLLRKGQNSENTKKTYERHIRDFFKTMRNKDIESLVEEDLIFEKSQIETYQVNLKEHYKGTTVNNTITALKECYEKLEDNGFEVKASWFNLERYDEHDKERYDTLTHDEVCQIIQLVGETRKGSEKALLVRLAYATAFRKESLLTMKWNQIINKDGIWYAKVLGKGNKWSHKKLSDDLYNALMEFRGGRVEDGKIFELTKKTVDKMMAYVRENMDFGDRKIVFHSFKKASLNEVNVLTNGDLKAIQAQGDHSDIKTSLNEYIENKKLEDLVVVDVNNNIPVEAFDELSHEELLNLVKSMDRNTQIKMLRQIGAI